MKRFFKWIGISLGVILIIGVVAGLIVHKPRPEGTTGPEADALAEKMLGAVDQAAWDSTRYVGWTFMRTHDFMWDREEDLVDVRWKKHRVVLHTPSQKGMAWTDGATVEDPEKLIDKAWFFFTNDSFWLQAFNKVFDPGTERAIVPQSDGQDALLVTYRSGGVTPGDSYLWILDEEGKPEAWRMWVKVLPIGGLTFSWENWQELSTGALVALEHKNAVSNVALTGVRGGDTLDDLDVQENPFAEANDIGTDR